jgi:hypothetical protein
MSHLVSQLSTPTPMTPPRAAEVLAQLERRYEPRPARAYFARSADHWQIKRARGATRGRVRPLHPAL